MSKSNLAKNTALLSIGTMLTKGINLIMIPLFSAWLSTEDYGMYDLLATYVSLLIPFITLSSSDAVFRFVIESNTDNDKKKYISTAFGINAINTCIVILGLIVIRLLTGWESFAGSYQSNKTIKTICTCQCCIDGRDCRLCNFLCFGSQTRIDWNDIWIYSRIFNW